MWGALEVEMEILVDFELRALMPPLTTAELEGLARQLVRDRGPRDPLVVWPQNNGQAILLDGHNRHEICRKRGLPYSTVELELQSREDAIIWICENQIARRNLNETQRAMVGFKMSTMKQGARTDLSPNGGRSQAHAANLVNVGERSIQRSGQS